MFDEQVRVARFLNIPLPAQTTNPSDRLITNDYLGVEVELERADHISTNHELWTLHSDGSLRNHGIEWVFIRPLQGVDAVRAMQVLHDNMTAAVASRSGPLKSVRTSVHVHVDARDLTKLQLMRMIKLYAIWERVVFNAYATARIDNHFAIPFTECVEYLPVIQWLYRGYDTFSNEMNHPNIGRYCAFNLKSLFKFGTVEFRHHGCEWDIDTNLEWINTCLAFKRGAMSDVDFTETFFTASQHGFENQLRQFFPRATCETVLAWYAKNGGSDQFHRDVVSGIRFVQHATSPKYKYE